MSEYRTREEWIEWAKSLKPGDKVITCRWGRLSVECVKRVTPKMWIVTDKDKTFYQGQWDTRFVQRGGYGDLLPWSEELQKKAEEQEAERQREEQERRTISDAKSICYELLYHKNGREMTLDLAKKIIELVEGTEGSAK